MPKKKGRKAIPVPSAVDPNLNAVHPIAAVEPNGPRLAQPASRLPIHPALAVGFEDGAFPRELLRLPVIDDALAIVWPKPHPRDVLRISGMLRAHGQLQPLLIDPHGVVVDPDGEAVLLAAAKAGVDAVRVRVQEPALDPIVMLATKLMREHWPLTRILAVITSETYWERFAPIIEAAQERQLAGQVSVGRGKSRDIIANAVGLAGKGRPVQTMLRAWKEMPELTGQIARGEATKTVWNLDALLQRRQGAAEMGAVIESGAAALGEQWQPIHADFWTCGPNRPGIGVDGFRGGVPDEIVANLVAWYTCPGDTIIDLMAGSGRTPDIAKALGRLCIAADQDPRRDDILQHRIEDGPLPGTEGQARLVIGDPPYHDMMHSTYGEDSSSGLPYDDFVSWLGPMARTLFATTMVGGYAATFMMNPRDPKRLLRRELERAMEAAGWDLHDELTISNPRTPTEEATAEAVRKQRLMPMATYVQVWRKADPVADPATGSQGVPEGRS